MAKLREIAASSIQWNQSPQMNLADSSVTTKWVKTGDRIITVDIWQMENASNPAKMFRGIQGDMDTVWRKKRGFFIGSAYCFVGIRVS